MGRQEEPLDPGKGPLAAFAHELRELRRLAGGTPYRQLAARTHYSASTLAAAAAGRRLPSAAVLAAFVTACGGDPEEWEARRVRTHALVTAPAVPPAPPASSEALREEAVRDEDVRDEGVRETARRPEVPAPRPPFTRRPLLLRRLLGLVVLLVVIATTGALVRGDAVTDRSGARAEGPRPTSVRVTGVALDEGVQWLRPGTDIPARYRQLIVRAGTMCYVPQVTPALVAAILKAESGFDPALSDPAHDEYGIARWTPRVLRYYLPPEEQKSVPVPPFTPEESIPAVGRMLCAMAPELEGVPGDPALNLAASYRTATWVVQRQGDELKQIRPYLDRVRRNLAHYGPRAKPGRLT
ncbi:helix-turn-helix domain-containing protein [Streptomyces sp. NPDC001941]|uniref:helix-turn-helix domain-containing protein n=1 Tax=Streptomyces sp. NPDC001941 TaxID=3154659 RepID=UPI00331D99E3